MFIVYTSYLGYFKISCLNVQKIIYSISGKNGETPLAGDFFNFHDTPVDVCE